MAVSGDKVHMEVIKVKRGCKGGALDKFDSLQEEEDFSLSPSLTSCLFLFLHTRRPCEQKMAR